MICRFLTNDNTYKYISNMGKNLSPWSVAIGDENIYFLTPHFQFNKREKGNDNELLKTKEGSADPFIIMLQIVEKTCFKNYKNMKFIQIMINIHKHKPKKLFGSSMLK